MKISLWLCSCLCVVTLFKTVLILNVHPGMTVYHTLMSFSKINAKDLIMQHAKFQICILKLTHWGRVTHICVNKLTVIDSDNGLSPGRPQVIIWTNAGLLLIGLLGTNFSEILSEIYTFLLKKIHLKMSSGKWRSFCLGLNVLNTKNSDYFWTKVYEVDHQYPR